MFLLQHILKSSPLHEVGRPHEEITTNINSHAEKRRMSKKGNLKGHTAPNDPGADTNNNPLPQREKALVGSWKDCGSGLLGVAA